MGGGKGHCFWGRSSPHTACARYLLMRESVVLKPRTDASANTFWSRVRDSSEYDSNFKLRPAEHGPDFKLESAAVGPTPFGRQVDPCARSDLSQTPSERETAADQESQACNRVAERIEQLTTADKESQACNRVAEHIERLTASGPQFNPRTPISLPRHRLQIECEILKGVVQDADEEKNTSAAEMRAEIERLKKNLNVVLRLNHAITRTMRAMHDARRE